MIRVLTKSGPEREAVLLVRLRERIGVYAGLFWADDLFDMSVSDTITGGFFVHAQLGCLRKRAVETKVAGGKHLLKGTIFANAAM